jgi:hypothetical protein
MFARQLLKYVPLTDHSVVINTSGVKLVASSHGHWLEFGSKQILMHQYRI